LVYNDVVTNNKQREKMIDYNKALEDARKQASKAKPWVLKKNGKIYTATFCLTNWHYIIYEDGFFLMNLNVRTATKAKKYLANWLDS